MKNTYQRYAIYYAPRKDTELAQFGREWLGLDLESGVIAPAPTPFVDSPRRYGFHATLKAPMRLSPSRLYEEFRQAVRHLSAQLKPVRLGQLEVRKIENFLALVAPEEFHPAISQLAWQCVERLDSFRAELNASERNKRKNLSLDEAQNLEDWGYPYVGERFRFHMTLTSSLDDQELEAMRRLVMARLPIKPVTLDSICIFGDPGEAMPFEFVERFDLKA